MALLAVIIPLLMLGVVLALGRYEELLLPKNTDQSEEAPAGPLGATTSFTILPSPAASPAKPSGTPSLH